MVMFSDADGYGTVNVLEMGDPEKPDLPDQPEYPE